MSQPPELLTRDEQSRVDGQPFQQSFRYTLVSNKPHVILDGYYSVPSECLQPVRGNSLPVLRLLERVDISWPRQRTGTYAIVRVEDIISMCTGRTSKDRWRELQEDSYQQLQCRMPKEAEVRFSVEEGILHEVVVFLGKYRQQRDAL